jgi:hypothetical protein
MATPAQTHNGSTPSQPWRLANDIQQLFGEDFDPDPLFLEESWTLGVNAAAENLYRRRQNQADREHQSRAFRELDNLGSLFFIENYESAAESLLADRAETIASRYASTWATIAAPVGDTQQSWSPADWAPNDRITQSWIPQGRIPQGVAQQNAAQEAEFFAEPWDNMTVAQAHHLLGTTTASTREQVRSAYRRMVSEWHPDRLQDASEAARERATRRMTAINEAHRLLRNTLLEDAA